MPFFLPIPALFLLVLLATPLSAKVPPPPLPVQIASPDREETWPWGDLLDSHWSLDSGVLTLVVTYSNQNLSDRNDPRRTEDLFFHFPAAPYDAASHSYSIAGKGGKAGRRVVAWRSPGFVKSTVLVPNATALVLRHGADVEAVLVVASAGRRFPRAVIETVHPGPFTLQALVEP